MPFHLSLRSLPPLAVVLTALLVTACERPQAQPPDAMPDADTLNALTDAERAAGWHLLFDGGHLDDHWRGFRRDSVPDAWRVDDDAIHFDPEGAEGGDLVTRDQYGSFELHLDWRIAEGGNSGVMYHVSEDGEATWHTGPEMQVLDNQGHPDAGNGLDRTAGALYDLYPPARDATRPAGEWNHARILVDGARVEHWLNGERIVAYERGSDDWRQRLADSKFADMPGFAAHERGHVALQDHGDPVWYRNIKVRPLD